MAEGSKTNASTTFTAAEAKFIVTAMSHLQGPIAFDFEAIATELGLKDATTARARWNTIKRAKLGGGAGAADTGVGVKKTVAAQKKKSKAGTDKGDVEDGGETTMKTPKKRGRKSKADKAAEETAKAMTEGDGEDVKLEDDEV